ncbi:MAG: DUF2911 domain-containing protein [Bryobacteraceae bacterium]
MTKSILISATLLTSAALSFAGNPQSPSAATSVTIAGKTISIKYSAPSLRGRQMFGPDGRISKDPTWPVWRAGADDATALHTDADLVINGLNVPKGDYTVFVLVNVNPWQLIINKQTKQWGLEYSAAQDLGRVPMTIMKPAAPIETFKITLSAAGGNKGKLQMEWENVIASVPFSVK